MNVNSFLKNCEHEYVIFSPHELKDKIKHDRIKYINMCKWCEAYNFNIRDTCKLLKSLIYKEINVLEYDWIVYSDSDILYFKDILKKIINLNKNNINISYDGNRKITNKFQLCSGFFVLMLIFSICF